MKTFNEFLNESASHDVSIYKKSYGNNITPNNTSYYVFWTAKITEGVTETKWESGMCNGEFAYTDIEKTAFPDVDAYKTAIVDCFKKDNYDNIMNAVSKSHRSGKIKLFFNIAKGDEIMSNKKYSITWKRCMKKVNAETLDVFDTGESYEKEIGSKIEKALAAKSNTRTVNTTRREMPEYDNYRYIGSINDPHFDYGKIRNLSDISSVELGRGHRLYYSKSAKIKWTEDSTD